MADARSPRKRGRDARRDDSPPRRRPPPKKQDTVDRKTECPFLLRVFCKRDGHNKIDDYSPTSVPSCEELQLYTWPDCTLRELTDLVKHALSDARRPRCRLSFAVVYPDKKGQTAMKEVGLIWSTNTARSPQKRTEDAAGPRFQTGDFIDARSTSRRSTARGPCGPCSAESPGADGRPPSGLKTESFRRRRLGRRHGPHRDARAGGVRYACDRCHRPTLDSFCMATASGSRQSANSDLALATSSFARLQQR